MNFLNDLLVFVLDLPNFFLEILKLLMEVGNLLGSFGVTFAFLADERSVISGVRDRLPEVVMTHFKYKYIRNSFLAIILIL